MNEIPTKPYLLRALFEWCVDNGYTPHVAVKVDSRAQVPSEYVKNGEITLNISPNAVHKLQMGNELIEFSARFGGVARQISVPIASVFALYARETGHGMTFDTDSPKPSAQAKAEAEPASLLGKPRSPAALPAPAHPEPPKKPSGGKPTLRPITPHRSSASSRLHPTCSPIHRLPFVRWGMTWICKRSMRSQSGAPKASAPWSAQRGGGCTAGSDC